MKKNVLYVFAIVCILIGGFVLSANLVSIFFTILNTGNPHDSGDLAGSTLVLYISPLLWLPASFVLYLQAPLDNPKQVFYKTFLITTLAVIINLILDYLLRRSF